jgi:hypothetical protein
MLNTFSCQVRPNTGNPFAPPPQLYNCDQGCLFDLINDPTEHVDLCASQSALCKGMQNKLATANLTYYEPFRGCPVVETYCAASDLPRNATFGPFVNVENCSVCAHTTPEYFASPNAIKQTYNKCQCYRSMGNCVGDVPCVWFGPTNVTGYCEFPPGQSQQTYLINRRWTVEQYDWCK